jgi:acyl-CoA synthetase (AMP-forming)/AMP-acid ligase II
MKLISNKDIYRHASILNEAWQSSEPFLLVPEVGAVSSKVMGSLVPGIPEKFSVNSFALLTSGSTGEPRIVIGSKDRAVALSQVLHDRQNLSDCQETVVVLPLTYGFAFVNQWVWSLVYGRKTLLTAGWSDPAVLESVLLGVSSAMICMVNTQVSFLERFFTKSFPNVTRVNFAGARFPQERIDTIRHFFPNARILNNYGCIEAMPRLTTRWEEESDKAENIGKPLPGVKLSTDEENNLLFRSEYCALGYVAEDGFHEFEADQWIKSGDKAEQLPDDSWELLGRTTDFLKRHGEKIRISEIVTAVLTVSRLEAEFYRTQDESGEDGFVVVLRPDPPSSTLHSIRKILRSEFSRAHWPLRIESIDSFPYLPNGKVDRVKLASAEGKRCLWSQRL